MTETTADYPPGEYAIVELFGHTTLIGRITEVERFGTKMLAIEALFRDTLLPPILHGGAAIYRLTPCEPDVAFAKQPREGWQLPAQIKAIIPPLLLETAGSAPVIDPDPFGGTDPDDDDDDRDRFDPDVDRHGR